MSIKITQNRSNLWTFAGFLMAILLAVISIVSIFRMWPPELDFFWFLMPILALGSTILGSNYGYWLLRPREVTIEIAKDFIRIEDQPFFKWKKRNFDPKRIKSISYSSESGTVLIERNGKRHVISDILMMKKNIIFEALRKMHPHIEIKTY